MDNTNMQPTQQITKKKKWLLPVILGVAALLVIGIGVGGFIYIKSVALPKKEVQRNLDLGDKYLTDMDYEKAVLSYKEAITIDPKNVKAYVGLGDAYLAWADELTEEGDTEEAIKKLKKGIKELKPGIDETGSDEVKEKKEELEERKKELEERKEEGENAEKTESVEKTEEKSSEEYEKTELYREAYEAYLNLLSSDPSYNLADLNGNPEKCVCFADIYGDEAPEMICAQKSILDTGDLDTGGYGPYHKWTRYIYTIQNGKMIDLIGEDWYATDFLPGSASICIFRHPGSKQLYEYSESYDGFLEYGYSVYHESDGSLDRESLFSYYVEFGYEDETEEYSQGKNPISKEEFDRGVQELTKDVEVVFYTELSYVNDLFSGSVEDKSMFYSDAINYLNDWLSQNRAQQK